MALNAGAIRFNTDSSQMEIWDGNQWTGILATSPFQQTGGTRGIWAGGRSQDIIDYANLDSTGNAISFGTLSVSHFEGFATASRTRFITGGTLSYVNTVEFVTITSTGSRADFGDQSVGRRNAAGYSNGGFMSYYLACNSKKFAAIGSVAGTMLDDSYQSCNANFPTAMINIHGTDDFDVPYDGNTYYPSIPDVVDWWKNFNNTPNEDVLTNQDGSIEQYIYYNDAGDRYVEHIKIIGGSHYWDDKLNYNGTNTSGLIWGFVSNYDIDGVIN